MLRIQLLNIKSLLKTLGLLVLMVLSLSVSKAQTTIPANTALSGVLDKIGSPYYVQGDVFVPADSTLLIEAGVEVVFVGKYQLKVFGNIKAVGTAKDTIRFYPLDVNVRWAGIRYYGKSRVRDSAVFKFCKFSFCGPKISNFDCAMILKKGHFSIENCVFNNHVSQIGVNSLLCDSVLSLNIDACHFTRNATVNSNPNVTQGVFGAVAMMHGTISNCIFDYNTTRNPYNSGEDAQLLDNFSTGGTLCISNYFRNPNADVKVLNCKFVSNVCGNTGGGISVSSFKAGKLLIKGCDFIDNRTGRYAALSVFGDGASNVKLIIDACRFEGNVAKNSMFGTGTAAIVIYSFYTSDSLIIKNSLFTKNVGFYACSFEGWDGTAGTFLYNNVFKNNYSGCCDFSTRGKVYSVNNQYYNNLYSNYYNGSDQFYAINDLYAYNGFKTDTVKLYKLWNLKYHDLVFSNAAPSSYHTGSIGAIYRNCIFWGNRYYGGKLNHLEASKTPFKEVSNCIFQGHVDSTVSINCSNCQYPYTNNITSRNAILYDNPLFIKPPPDFGPDANTDSVDFHTINTCTTLSPVYNAGMNTPLNFWFKDGDAKSRVSCDTVDIGPYELPYQYKTAHITRDPKDSSFCDDAVVLQLSSTCNPNAKITWQRLNGSMWTDVIQTNSNNYHFATPVSGQYRAIYKQLDCQVVDTSKAFNLSLRTAPKPFLGRDTSIGLSDSLVLKPGKFDSYVWQDNATDSVYHISGFLQDLGEVLYWVKVGYTNGCYATDSILVTVVANSSLTVISKLGWYVYPNPSRDEMYLSSESGKFCRWTLISTTGEFLSEGTQDDAIQLNEYASGIYLLKLQSDGREEFVKILKVD